MSRYDPPPSPTATVWLDQDDGHLRWKLRVYRYPRSEVTELGIDRARPLGEAMVAAGSVLGPVTWTLTSPTSARALLEEAA